MKPRPRNIAELVSIGERIRDCERDLRSLGATRQANRCKNMLESLRHLIMSLDPGPRVPRAYAADWFARLPEGASELKAGGEQR